MTSSWLFQLTVSIIVILSISLVVRRLLEINLSKSLLISISLITLFSLLLNALSLYKLSINILIIISIVPFFFSSIRKIILEEKSLIIEFILVILVIFYLSHNRILMDEDELYFWAVKYKYFVLHFDKFNIYNFDIITDPFRNSGYGNATAIFQSFITSFIGYNEGGAIFANNIIIICAFYFLFADKVKKLTHRFFYFLIFYLVLNNLSFGLLSIYSDPIVTTTYAVLVYYVINDFDYKKLKSITLLLILLLFFIEVHRISLVLAAFLLIILLIKNYKNQKNIYILLLNIGFFIIFFYLLIINFSSYSFYYFDLSDNLYFYLNESVFFIKTIFLSKNYNSQFGVSYNAIINFLKIDLIKLPEYVWHNFIWYFICLTVAFVNRKKTKELNIFFLIIFSLFSCVIIINKIYLHDTSPQVFGRYISFILIPYILISSLYLNFFVKKEYVAIFFITFFLMLSTPKKTFGFFFTQDFYTEYDQWNKDYYEVRNKHKKLFNEIKNDLKNEIYNAYVIFKDSDITYDAHPSLYQSALKIDLYPNKTTIVTFDELTNEKYHADHFMKDSDVLIFYNLDINQKNMLGEINKKFDIKRKFDFKLRN